MVTMKVVLKLTNNQLLQEKNMTLKDKNQIVYIAMILMAHIYTLNVK